MWPPTDPQGAAPRWKVRSVCQQKDGKEGGELEKFARSAPKG